MAASSRSLPKRFDGRLATALLCCFLHGQIAMMGFAATEVAMDLPKTVHDWTMAEEPRRILPGGLFEYMDGAGELYLAYRFKYLDVYQYALAGQQPISVELYWMKSSDDAFGLLSGDWNGDAVDLGQGAAQTANSRWTGRRAIYGKGLLRIWSNDLYVRILAFRETAASKEAVLALGRLIVAGRDNPAPPRWLAALPAEGDAGFMLRSDRVCFLRSHLVLNSAYFVSTNNILDLDVSVDAVTATYRSPESTDRRSVRLLLVRYGDAEKAAAAVRHFEKIYLPEKHLTPQSSAGGRQFWKIEDGWLGYTAQGRCVALVFECSGRESAVRFLENALKTVREYEATHE